MIPPGGIRSLVVVVVVVVLGLAVVNAGRGAWGLAVNGAMLAAWIGVVVVWLRRPPSA